MAAQYAAFISYRHVEPDRRWARWLHSALETYHVPRRLSREQGRPRRVGRVFRDEEELAASPHLSKEIEKALLGSDWLIVVCSPRTPASSWVNAEVDFFRSLGRGDRILSLLIEGEPASSFPPSLFEIRSAGKATTQPDEPLAADVRPLGGTRSRVNRRAARLRLLAAVLGCPFDDLRRREQERRRRNAFALGAGIVALLAVLAVLGLVAELNRRKAELAEAAAKLSRQQAEMEVRRRHEQASLRLVAQAYQVLYRDPIQAVVYAQRALEENPSDDARAALGTAHRVILHHRRMRHDAATLTDTAGFSFERRVRKGAVYTVLSRAGRHVLLATKRGDDPYTPEVTGDAYVMDNETLQTRKLEPCSDQSRPMRLEYAAFSSSGENIFVSRGFYVDVYRLDGTCSFRKSLFFQATKSPIHIVAGYLNGRYLLGGDSLGQVWLLESTGASTSRPVGELGRPEGDARRNYDALIDVQLSPDARAALATYESGRVDLLNLGADGNRSHWPVLARGGLATAFDPAASGAGFLTAEEPGLVRRWTVGGGRLRQVGSLAHKGRAVEMASYSADSKWIVSVDAGCNLWIWDAAAAKALNEMKLPAGLTCEPLDREVPGKSSAPASARPIASEAEILPPAPAARGRQTAATVQSDSPILDAKFTRKQALAGHKGEIFDLAFSGDGNSVLSASADGTVRVWDVRGAGLKRELTIRPFEYVLSVAADPKRNRVVAGTSESNIQLWDLESGAALSSSIPQTWGPIRDLAFSPDGNWLIVVAESGHAYVWSLTKDSLAAAPEIGRGGARSCVFVNKGRSLILGTGDGSLVQLDGATWSTTGLISGVHQRGVGWLSADRLGTRFASGDRSGIRIWRFSTPLIAEERVQPLQPPVTSVAVSPDARMVASGLGNGTVVVWDASSGRQLGGPLAAHGSSSVTGLAFSPDGRLLVSGGGDAKVVVWSIDRRSSVP